MGFWEVEYGPCGCYLCCFCCYNWWMKWRSWLQQRRQLRQWRRRQRRRWCWRRRDLINEDIEFLKMELRSIHAALRLVEAVPLEQLPHHLKSWAIRSREASYDIQDILDTFLVRVEDAHPDSSKGLARKMAHPFLRYKTRREIAEAICRVETLVHDISQDRAVQLQRERSWNQSYLGAEIAERSSWYSAGTLAANNAGSTSVDTCLSDQIKVEMALAGADRAMEEVIGKLSMDDTDDTTNHQLKTVCIVGTGGLTKSVYGKLRPRFDCSAFVSLIQIPNIRKALSFILQQLDNGKHTSQATEEWDERRLVDQLKQLLQDKRYIIAVDDIKDVESWQAIRHAMIDNNLGSRIITATRIPNVAEQVGAVCEVNDDHNSSSRNILLHSYYQLPSQLRPCFLYISMFPENYEFRRDRLVWRWIAEGFIEGKEGCSLLESGQKYLEELLNRSLIREVDKDVSDGMGKYCHVHYMVHDLACSLARDENFIPKLVDEWEEHFEQKVRRLSLQNSHLGRRAHTLQVGHVRSVGAFGTEINLMPPLSNFHILRVLDLEGCDLTGSYYNAQHLVELFHLRYLGLRATNVSQLPKDIGNLRFLQILDFKGTRIRELPSTVVLLPKLLCLYAEPETRIPMGMGNLTSLEELSKVSVSESPSLLKELNMLVELRVLDIVVGELSREDLQTLGELPKLRFLCLEMERMGDKLAVDAESFPNLTQLRLWSETCLVFHQGAMPKVEVLEFVLDVDKANDDFNWGLSNLCSLEKVTVKLLIGNSGSGNKEKEAKSALWHSVGSHPNRRRIHLEISTATSHQQAEEKQIASLDDDGAGNVASSSEIQEERYASSSTTPSQL